MAVGKKELCETCTQLVATKAGKYDDKCTECKEWRNLSAHNKQQGRSQDPFFCQNYQCRTEKNFECDDCLGTRKAMPPLTGWVERSGAVTEIISEAPLKKGLVAKTFNITLTKVCDSIKCSDAQHEYSKLSYYDAEEKEEAAVSDQGKESALKIDDRVTIKKNGKEGILRSQVNTTTWKVQTGKSEKILRVVKAHDLEKIITPTRRLAAEERRLAEDDVDTLMILIGWLLIVTIGVAVYLVGRHKTMRDHEAMQKGQLRNETWF